MDFWKWLSPGMEVKRWLIITIIGFILVSAGLFIIFEFNLMDYIVHIILRLAAYIASTESGRIHIFVGLLITATGIALIWFSLRALSRRISEQFLRNDSLVDVLYKNRANNTGPRIVALGGGTGLSSLLRGIKEYTSNITAIVTVADDGGSSGILRDEMGILPPGDIRSCLVALADEELLLRKLFQYRFSKEGRLEGHSFGNLFIATMTGVLEDFEEAVKESSKVLAIRGQVLPATTEDIHLGAIYQDNSVKLGESAIPRPEKRIREVFLKPSGCQPTEAALQAIAEAEIITVGPGSLYTSILPNLLVKGIAEAIKSSRGISVYVCNVMTQPGETTGYSAYDHLKVIDDHVGEGLFDYVLINTGRGDKKTARRYREEGSYPVEYNRGRITELGVKVVEADMLSATDYIRHDPQRLAAEIIKLAGRD